MEFILLLASLTGTTIYESRYDNYNNSYHYVHLFRHRTKYSLYLFRPSSRVTIFIIIIYIYIYIYDEYWSYTTNMSNDSINMDIHISW